MAELGRTQKLVVLRTTPIGAYLDDGDAGILLPRKDCPPDIGPSDAIEVFIYTDSEDRPIATTRVPLVQAGGFAALKCVASGDHGAFLDMGLEKDLFLPKAEMREPVNEGQMVVVHVRVDDRSHRLVASAKLNRFLKNRPDAYREGQPVSMLVYGFAPDAAKVIVDDEAEGSLFDDEIFTPLKIGDRRKAFIKRVRPDGKIALSLRPLGFRAALEESPAILAALKDAGGFLPLSDASTPEAIRRQFGMSKGSFKKAIGTLMKEGKIEIEHHGIRLRK